MTQTKRILAFVLVLVLCVGLTVPAMAEDIIPSIISAQSADVDTVSGATFSSTAIKNATKQALDKAVK